MILDLDFIASVLTLVLWDAGQRSYDSAAKAWAALTEQGRTLTPELPGDWLGKLTDDEGKTWSWEGLLDQGSPLDWAADLLPEAIAADLAAAKAYAMKVAAETKARIVRRYVIGGLVGAAAVGGASYALYRATKKTKKRRA